MKKLLRRIIRLVLIVGLSVGLVVWFFGYQEYQEVTKDHNLVTIIHEIQNQDHYATYETVPSIFYDAIVSVEDARYWDRQGVLDFRALGRAIFTNVKNMSLEEGGSTIPQQVSKNLYFDHAASLVRKVSEYYVTRDLLNTYNKQEILEIYVNIIYYGNGAYGILDATQNYFDLNPWELNEGELVILAGLPQAPSVYDLTQNFDLAKERQKHVLERMVVSGHITETRASEIYNMEVRYYETYD